MGEAVSAGDWKYHKKKIFRIGSTARESEGPSLYKLKQDTSESFNVIKQYPEVTRRLSSSLEEHMNSYSK